MCCKYIRFQWAGFVLWDALAPLSHATMAQHLQMPGDGVLTAGFVAWKDGAPVCEGESSTLGLKAGADDTHLLRAQMGMRPAATPAAGAAAPAVVTTATAAGRA